MSKFKAGDKVVMNQGSNFVPVYFKGDVGVLQHMDNMGDWRIDFTGQGNEKVVQDGQWYASEDRFDLVELGADPIKKPKPPFTFGTFIRRVRTIDPVAANWLRDEFRTKEVFNKLRGYAETNKEVREQCDRWADRYVSIGRLFVWGEAPQGHAFWMDIDNKYRAKYK